jgi:hypothetical protein
MRADVEEVFDGFEDRGWTDETKLDLLATYVACHPKRLGDVRAYLRRVVKEEERACGDGK